MPTRQEIAYFGAGPAPMPTAVLETGARAFVNYEDSGLSLAEISHRSPLATRILADTTAALSTLLSIPDTHEILFCHGGGTAEFSAVVFNLVACWVERRRRRAEKELGADEGKILERLKKEVQNELKLDYVVTGSWSLKASQEAANLLEPVGKNIVNVVVDARKHHTREQSAGKFTTVPDENIWNLTPSTSHGPADSAFIYYCDNETVDGVEFPDFPSSLDATSADSDQHAPIVADMSSNFLSRRVDVSKYGVIFGGAQKNIGITDLTLVIVRKSLLALQPPPSLLHALGIWSPPIILHWPTLAQHHSLYNTLPIFSLFIAGEVMRASLALHGPLSTRSQEELATHKAAIVYAALDRHPQVYRVCADERARSRMNICFRIKGGDDVAEKAFLAGAEDRRLLGLKGHRSVGGVRVSNYNAVALENVDKLVRWMEEFAVAEVV